MVTRGFGVAHIRVAAIAGALEMEHAKSWEWRGGTIEIIVPPDFGARKGHRVAGLSECPSTTVFDGP